MMDELDTHAYAHNDGGFDPIAVACAVERAVQKGDTMLYHSFQWERYYGGIASARSPDSFCNLRCACCYVGRTAEEAAWKYYSPQEVYDGLLKVVPGEHGEQATLFRLAGREPTIGWDHLMGFLRIVAESRNHVIALLETNGMRLGNDKTLVEALAEFREKLIVRLSFKAGTPEAFRQKTGAREEAFELPFQALRHLEALAVPTKIAAMTGDVWYTGTDERRELYRRILSTSRLSPWDLLLDDGMEEETIEHIEVTDTRLAATGFDEKNAEGVYEPFAASLVRYLLEQGIIDANTLSRESLKTLLEDKERVLGMLDEVEFHAFARTE